MLFITVYSCEVSQKYWCDSFNGEESCYKNILCTTFGSPINVSEYITNKYKASITNLLKNTACSLENFSKCNVLELTEYLECVEDGECLMLLDPGFLSSIPEIEWLAVKPKYLRSHIVEEEELESYVEFQACITKCSTVCKESLEADRECIENCVLSFCV